MWAHNLLLKFCRNTHSSLICNIHHVFLFISLIQVIDPIGTPRYLVIALHILANALMDSLSWALINQH